MDKLGMPTVGESLNTYELNKKLVDAMAEVAELKAIIEKLDPEIYRGLVIEEELEKGDG